MRKETKKVEKVETTNKYNNRAYVMDNMLSVGGFDLTSKDLMNVGRRYPTHLEIKRSGDQAFNDLFAGVDSRNVGPAKDIRVNYKPVEAEETDRLAIYPEKNGPYKITVKKIKCGSGKEYCYYQATCPREEMDKFAPIPPNGHCCHFGLRAFDGGFVIVPIELPRK